MPYGVDRIRPAVVAIDLHRGHLDPAVATMPVMPGTEQRIIAANHAFFAACRAAGVPICHLVTTYRDVLEIRGNAFWHALAQDPAATRRNNERHNLQGSPGCEIIPGLYQPGDWVVNTKKRYNCFQETDLRFLLDAHQVNTLFITGVNTNSCVLATTAVASSLDYAVFVVEDCVDSMDGPALHEAALTCMRAAFAWVMPSARVLAEVVKATAAVADDARERVGADSQRDSRRNDMAEGARETTVHADGMRIDWDVPITADDGLVLRADVYRPDADGQYPVLLTYGAYGKGLSFQEGYPDQWNIMVREHPDVAAGSTNKYQNWEVVDPEKWVPAGYVCVRVDSRGAGRSPGYIDPFSPRETRDCYDCIEWAGTQPWSNGKVGMLGISYYAINQWDVASMQPPHLVAICPWEGAADFYRDMSRHGGILSDFWGNWVKKQVVTVQHGLGARGPRDPNSGLLVAGPETLPEEDLERNRTPMVAQALAHPLDDQFYRERSPDWSRVTVPLLTAGNWGGQGLHLRGNVEGFVRAASSQKWLELHGLEHWTHFYTEYGHAVQQRFFDHFLKGLDNGWQDEPPVLLQVRHLDGFVPRQEHEWPLARTRWTPLYLDTAARALAWEPVATEHAVTYDALGDGITLIAGPLEHETEITGPVAAHLVLSSDTVDADVFVTVRAFSPDGAEVDFQGALDPHTPLAQGWLRASHRKLDLKHTTPYYPYHTHDEQQLLLAGTAYELEVELWPTSVVLPAGYRLALTVQGKDFERATEGTRLESFVNPFRGSGPFIHTNPQDRPVEIFGGRHTLYSGGSTASYVLLPMVPA